MSQARIAAFFDFDKTLLEVESAKLGLKWLWDKRMMPIGYTIRLLAANLLHSCHLLSEERMAVVGLSFYKNRRLDDLKIYAEEFYHEYLKPCFAPQMLSRVDFHRREGHVLVLISGSPRYYLEPVVTDLGFHHLLCTDLEEDGDGILTGKPEGPMCLDANKKSMAMELAKKVGLDLQRSYAYGNHQADIPLLQLVGRPHVVEPTIPLKKVAIQRSWPILSFR